MVNHAAKNEMAKITVTPYMAGMVNHTMKNEWVRLQSLHMGLVWSTMPQRINTVTPYMVATVNHAMI